MWPFLPGIGVLLWSALLFGLRRNAPSWMRYRARVARRDPALGPEADRVAPQVLLVVGSLGVNVALTCMLLGSRMWPNLGITACATVCMLLLGRLYMERYLEAGFGPEQASDPARSSRTGQGDPS